MTEPINLFDLYFDYVKQTEPPAIFHRWALIGSTGAWLGRQLWLPFGTGRIFPNMYIIFVGDPGTRKSTAIKGATRIIRKAGFDRFGPQKTSKEKFMADLAADSWDDEDEEDNGRDGKRKGAIDVLKELRIAHSGDDGSQLPHEVFVAADEFNNFLGPGNIDFQSLLGELWDWDEPDRNYTQRLKNSKSVSVYQPTVSILGGTTPSQFAECFPLASIGQGFMSRLILIHGEESGVKITFPPAPEQRATEALIRHFVEMRARCKGPVTMSPEAENAFDIIYKGWIDLEDPRFKHYSTRRFTHLLKVAIIVAAMRLSTRLEMRDVLEANTLVSYAETRMAKAIGELGKSKNSEAANKIMQMLYGARKDKTVKELWVLVQNDLNSPQELAQILSNLEVSEKIQTIKRAGGENGYLPRQKIMNRDKPFTNFELLKGKEVK